MGLLSWLRRDKYGMILSELENLKDELFAEIQTTKLLAQEAKMKAESANLSAKEASSRTKELEQELSSITKTVGKLVGVSRIAVSTKKELDELKNALEQTILKSSKEKHHTSLSVTHHNQKNTQLGDPLLNLSRSEKAIINVLLHSDMPMSYEEIASILSKSPSTVRDHISSIRKKTDFVEVVESADRKKLFRISLKIKNRLLG